MREPANVRKRGKVWLLDGGAGGKRPNLTRSSTSVRAIRFGNVDTPWMTFPHEESPENRGRADADRRILREATGFVGAPLPAVRKRIYCRPVRPGKADGFRIRKFVFPGNPGQDLRRRRGGCGYRPPVPPACGERTAIKKCGDESRMRGGASGRSRRSPVP